MNHTSHPYGKLMLFSALFTASIALLVLIAWLFDFYFLLNLGMGAASMKFNTALLLLSASFGLLSVSYFNIKKLTQIIGVILLVAGALSGLQYWTGTSLGIDNLLARDMLSRSNPGRMSFATSICFIFLGTSFIGVYLKQPILKLLTQHLLFLIGILTLLAIQTFILEIPSPDKMLFDTMGIHTALSFFVLSQALSLKNYDLGFTSLIISSLQGSRALRFLLPFVILIPIILSFFLVSYTQLHPDISRDFLLTIYTSTFILLVIVYLSYVANRLNEADKERYILRKELEETNKKIKRHWKSLVENTPDLIARVDKNYRFDYVNEAMHQEMIGVDGASMLNKTPAEVGFPKEDVQRYYRSLEKVFKGEKSAFFTDFQTPEGILHLYTLVAPEFDEDGVIRHAISITRDITPLKKSEESLKRSTDFLKSLLSHVPDGIARFDRKGVCLYVNEVKEAKWQKPKEEIIGKPVDQLDIPGGEEIKDAVAKTLESNEIVELTLEISEHDVRNIWFVPEKNMESLENTVLMISRDVTTLAQKQRELEMSESRYKSIFENVPMTILRMTPDYRYDSINRAIKINLGIQPEALLGKSIYEAGLEPKVLERFEKHLSLAKETQKQVAYEENYVFNKNERYVKLTIVPEVNPNGAVSSLLVLSTDLTESRKNEQKLHHQNEELEYLNNELEAFTYTVSHDLRSPLRAIVGFAEKLRRSASKRFSDEENRYLAVIDKSAHRMALLIDELLKFSRIDKIDLNKVHFKPGSLIREVMYGLEESTSRKVHLHIEDLPEVYADREMFRQVVHNLLSNSVKYAKENEDASIHISGKQKGKMTELIFTDQGIGFDPRFRHRIFEVFHRLHKPDEYFGVGVGLSIVDRIVSRHGGKVWADSEVGQGASFHVKIPNE